MNELNSTGPGMYSEEPMLDSLLRESLPEIKLALGDLIDRDNTRAIPDRYAKILPQTVLLVTLRPDAAEAVMPIAAELERELSESCTRHGSLYDRSYKVKLRSAGESNAPLFRVAVSGGDKAEPGSPAAPEGAGAPATPLDSVAPTHPMDAVVVSAGTPNVTVAAPGASPPSTDPDATRVEGIAPAAPWEPGRFSLVVEDGSGGEREVFPLVDPITTVGRYTEDPNLRSAVSIADAPHVSRRQLALVWAPRGEDPGFAVHNLGLNPVRVADQEIVGANQGRGPLRMEALRAENTGWAAPGTALRIGEQGPTLRLRENESPAVDPDATRFG